MNLLSYEITIEGLVQGIGFRPYIAKRAKALDLKGFVRNAKGIVTVKILGQENSCDAFIKELRACSCPGAEISDIRIVLCEEKETFDDFTIIKSDESADTTVPPVMPADLPTCKECENELLDEKNRRFLHPFISCVHCGPRYSILKKLPYDRENINMSMFPMCPDCGQEYVSLFDRRRHAQTIACKNCGPKLSIIGNEAEARVFAIKDIGGYHIAASPYDHEAVVAVRKLKGRETKPFAVMFSDVESIKKVCLVSEEEEKLLLSNPRPIVLLERKSDEFDYEVCGNSPYIGAFLPSNPLQILFIKEHGSMIMTSANKSGGLMITDNEELEDWFRKGLLDSDISWCILSHDRDIELPLDDGIVRHIHGQTQIIRRARGFVPSYISVDLNGSYFAAGGDLKAAFAYIAQGRAYFSTQFGDLEHPEVLENYKKEKERMSFIFGFEPDINICDRHPGYISHNLFKEMGAKEVFHHIAHGASVICEHGLKGDVLAVAFDGTGFAEDGSIEGSAFFKFSDKDVTLFRHLKPVSLAGGDLASKDATLSMYGYLASFEENLLSDAVDTSKLNTTRAAVKMQINRIKSTSMGRLFDAVGAFLGVSSYNSYEGEVPCELEYLAFKGKDYPLENITAEGDTYFLFKSIKDALLSGIPKEDIARGFHNAIARWILTVATEAGIKQIVLSGGTFMNRLLVEKTFCLLEENGFKVYINNKLPCSDAGIALGQAYLVEKYGG